MTTPVRGAGHGCRHGDSPCGVRTRAQEFAPGERAELSRIVRPVEISVTAWPAEPPCSGHFRQSVTTSSRNLPSLGAQRACGSVATVHGAAGHTRAPHRPSTVRVACVTPRSRKRMMPANEPGLEAGPADQRTVDVGARHQVGGVLGLDRAAVLDAHRRRPRRPPPPTPPWRGSCAHTAWASSGVAVRPVPIAQIGSYAMTSAADLLGGQAGQAGRHLARSPWPRWCRPRARRASRPRTGSASCRGRRWPGPSGSPSRRSRRTARAARSARRSRRRRRAWPASPATPRR